MQPVWIIDGNDIIGLQGKSTEFVQVVNTLLAQQAQRANIPHAAVRLNVKDTEGDGGVDAVVTQSVPGDPTGFLEVKTCWQYKAQAKSHIKPSGKGKKTRRASKDRKGKGIQSQEPVGQEAALREEIRKPHVQKLIKQGYGYRFCIADDMPDQQKAEWETWLTDEAKQIFPSARLAKVVTASNLAEWVNRYPAVVTGVFRPFLGKLISLAQWHSEFRSITREFVHTADWPATADKVRRYVDFAALSPSVLIVQGEAGVGKSRAICEALHSDVVWEPLVAVTRDELHALDFADVIAKNPHTRAILVADECSVDVRVKLDRIVASCSDRLRVIAIDNSLQRERGTEEIRLNHFETEEVDLILSKNFETLPADRRRAYADLVGGFVRLAVDLCRHGHLVPADGRIDSVFGFFHDSYLKHRLKPEELEAVELLSLLPRVGYRDDVKSELDALCDLPFVERSPGAIVKAARDLKQSPGFIAFAGRYLYVTPALIRRVAFQGAWNRWIALDPPTFLKALPASFITPFIQQTKSAGTEEMKQAVSDFFLDWMTKLGPPDLGSEETVLRLAHLVEARPDSALPLLRSLLDRASLDELKHLHSDSLDGQHARRQLVWLAEKLAHFPETFTDAEAMLWRLAEVETEVVLGNSASRIWAELFRIVLSGTPIPFLERLALLERRLNAAGSATLPLVLAALDEILADGPVSQLVTPPVLFGRIPPPQWRPADQGERQECRRAALAMAARVASNGGTVAEGIRNAVVRRLSPLLLAGFLDEVRGIIGTPPLPDDLLTTVVQGVDDFLNLFCRDHDVSVQHSQGANNSTTPATGSRSHKLYRVASVDLEARVREWYRSLIPRDIHSRLVTLIGQEYWHQQLDGDHKAWERAVDELASELVRSSADLQRELPWLSSPNARSAYRLGQALAGADTESVLLDRMLSEIPKAGGDVLARGYLERVTITRPDFLPRINEKLDRLQEENPKAAFDIIWSAGDEVRKVERVFAMVDRGRLGPEFLRSLEYGVRNRKLREDELLGAVDRLLQAGQEGSERAPSVAIHLLYTWLRPNRGEPTAESLRTHSKVLEAVLRVLEATLEAAGSDSDFWVDLAEDLTTVRPGEGSRLLAKALFSRDYGTRSMAEESLVRLANKYPSEIMEAIGESALNPVNRFVFQFGNFSQLLGALPEKVVCGWLERVGKRGALAIARHLPPPALAEENEPLVPPVTEYVLSRYENDDEIFREFLLSHHSGQVYMGDIAEQHEEEAKTARRFLGHPLKRVREWATAEIQFATQESQFWRQRDEETATP